MKRKTPRYSTKETLMKIGKCQAAFRRYTSGLGGVRLT
jgi:hypothetical protein